MDLEPRVGDWITTFTGRRFFPFDPRIEDIDINDIVHALCNMCRFNGHSISFYSVGQHSVLVSSQVPPEHALRALLHDASEAYIADIPSPLKKMPEMAFYRDAEKKLMNVICDAFDLEHEEPESVKIADKRMLVTEARDLTFTAGRGWTMRIEPYDFNIQPWSPEHTRIRFLARFHELMKARGK